VRRVRRPAHAPTVLATGAQCAPVLPSRPVPSLLPRRHVHQHQQQAPGGAVRTASRSLGASCGHRTGRSSTSSRSCRGFPEAKLHDGITIHISWQLRCDDQDLSNCVRQLQRQKERGQDLRVVRNYIYYWYSRFVICSPSVKMPSCRYACLLCKLSFCFGLFYVGMLLDANMQPPARPFGPPHDA
jgi:hypothetical protein